MEKWIEELKVGDKFAVDHGRYGKTEYYIHTITKITLKQIITDMGYSFWKEKGQQVGHDKWHNINMEVITEKIRDWIFRNNVKNLIRMTNLDKLNLGQLERIREAILDR